MTKTAYCFLLVVIGLALLMHACDERSDRTVIHQAAGIALYDGVENACAHRNRIRDAIWQTAAFFHENARRDQVRSMLNYEDCDVLAREQVVAFNKRLKDKDGTNALLEELQKLP